jgi:hypothetical protein
MSLGPTGKFIAGKPLVSGDRGELVAGFVRVPGKRQYVMNFGTELSFFQATREQAKTLADSLQQQVAEDFGKLPYDKNTLPIKVECDLTHHTLRILLPQSVEILVANPEVWLALADEIKTKLRQLPPVH